MTIKYELLKKLVVAAGLKKRWLSATMEGQKGWELMVRLMKEETSNE